MYENIDIYQNNQFYKWAAILKYLNWLQQAHIDKLILKDHSLLIPMLLFHLGPEILVNNSSMKY